MEEKVSKKQKDVQNGFIRSEKGEDETWLKR